MPAIAAITGEYLVPSIARQCHRDILAGHCADLEGRQRRAVPERLVVDRRQAIQKVERIRVDRSDAVVGAIALGGLPSVGRLVPPSGPKGNREGADRLRLQTCHHCHHTARIDTAGQKGAERDVGDHPDADRFAQTCNKLFLDLFTG